MLKDNEDLSYKDSIPSVNTISYYVKSILDSYLFYDVLRYDIKESCILKTLGKYYIIDNGLRNYLVGYDKEDLSILENIIYFELRSRNYEVYNGKFANSEITFVAMKNKKRIYVELVKDLKDVDGSIKLMKKIEDNYPKIILVASDIENDNIDGIELINIIDYLLDK